MLRTRVVGQTAVPSTPVQLAAFNVKLGRLHPPNAY